jgi:transcriptional regulator with XRE-family HTH domain
MSGLKNKQDSLSKRLRTYRLTRGLTLKQVADQIQVPVSTYRDWEYGREIKGEPYLALAEVFAVSIGTLMTGATVNKEAIQTKLDELKLRISELEKLLISLF